MNKNAQAQARKFALESFDTKASRIRQQSEEKLTELHARRHSRILNRADVGIYVERLERLIQARLDAFVEAYDTCALQIDEEESRFILADIQSMCAQTVGGTISGVQGRLSLTAQRTGSNIAAANASAASFKRELERAAHGFMKEIKVQLERRKLSQRFSPLPPREEDRVTYNYYHLEGDNSRVNVESVDRSTNVVSVTTEELFRQLAAQIQRVLPAGDQRDEILAKLGTVQSAPDAKSFAQRYADFIAIAADHTTVITPFLPALAELAQKFLK